MATCPSADDRSGAGLHKSDQRMFNSVTALVTRPNPPAVNNVRLNAERPHVKMRPGHELRRGKILEAAAEPSR